MKIVVHVLIASILLLSLATVPAAAEPPERVDVLIGFHRPPGVAERAMVRDAGGDIKYTFRIVPVIAASLPESAVDALLRKAGVRYIEPVIEVYAIAQTVPWGIDRVFGDEGYSFPTWGDSRGQGIAVAVLDTGIDENHEDLNVLGGTNTIDQTHWGSDGHGHGTHVAGTIAALDNDLGVVGVAPLAGLYAVKVLSDAGSGTDLSVAQGIEWAVENNIPVLNMSLGGPDYSQTLKDACDAAYAAGHLLVAAAGNSGTTDYTEDNVLYPAKYGSVIAVAGSNDDDERIVVYWPRPIFRWASSTGPAVELIAPGQNVLSTLPGNVYGSGSGTSMASPHAAGAAALAWAANPALTNVQIRGILQETAEDLGLDEWEQGHGLVRADLAVAAALATLPPEPGYTFTAPSAIPLGDMAPRDEPYVAGSETDGTLEIHGSGSYTVTGKDEKAPHTGHMVVVVEDVTYVLANMFQISKDGIDYHNADIETTFLDVNGAGNHTFEFHVSQMVTFTDPAVDGYTITITFEVMEKT